KPDVDSIEGLSPAIAIEQKTTSHNPRSTVGTVTELYDYLRLLYARVGTPTCHRCGRVIAAQTVSQMVDTVMALREGAKIQVLAPIARGRKGEYKKELAQMVRKGFVRARVDGGWVQIEDVVELDKKRPHTIEIVVDRLAVKPGIERRLADSLEAALPLGNGSAIVNADGTTDHLFSERLACVDCGVSSPEIEPRLFSFNSPHGACPSCDGLGVTRVFDLARVVPDPSRSLREGAIRPWERRTSGYYEELLEAVARHYGFSVRTPFGELPPAHRQVVLYGSGEETVECWFEKSGRRQTYQRPFEGVIPNLDRRYRETTSPVLRAEFEQYMSEQPCPACRGARLKPESLAVKVGGLSIAEVTRLSIRGADRFIRDLRLGEQAALIAQRILKELRERLGFLVNVGVDYLALDRSAATLSGGEGQRIRLATQIGASLVGVLYVLDEPSIGLHQRDNRRLLDALTRLRDLGNSVLVVEHDEETILAADHVIDMGPGAGVHGGTVVAEGPPAAIMAHPASLTGRYLTRELAVGLPPRIRPTERCLTIVGATEHNLKDLTVPIPLGLFTCVTGVSGSGKSTLIIDILYKTLAQRLYRAADRPGACRAITGAETLDKVVNVDQSPIGRTPRSNPATYTGVFALIRDLYTQLPESKARGYKAGRYSFNVKGGRCESCQGDGVIKIEMHFLPDVYVTCDACHGRRYNRETLDVRYKDRSIADVLDMTVEQALEFFAAIPAIRQKIETLRDVGLDYARLGQSATTLSGGEAQRVKLAKELSRRATGNTVYILDEPTTGLHFADIQRLLDVLNRLVESGNTVVVIEHNLDVIRNADHVIDLGPEGGDGGGELVASGSPEEVSRIARSLTGRFLARTPQAGPNRTGRKMTRRPIDHQPLA
ncbi:MAG TPA: excinuclease ABC subunit UvrA, partial [Nitrospiria bacterium]|nr:excinuclease ABC subunit UvrA [Nitrospiria bacterium]